MKRWIIKFAAIAVLLLTLPVLGLSGKALAQESGTTYYVDYRTGDDNNDGKSEAAPWKTARRVNETIFQPGDKILLRAGSVWNGERFAPSGSGAEGAHITIDRYGEGNKPIL
ncbi:MAG: hypothetical protein ACI4D2_04770, partial [Lachnospiraceae bacterium]